MMRDLVLSVALACGLCFAHGAAGEVTHAFDLERSETADMVVLRNGDRLSGTVRDGAWTLATRQGAVTLDGGRLAGLRLGQADAPDLMVTVNANLLAGRLERGPIAFTLSAGPALSLDPDTVATILFRLREDDGAELPVGRYARLHSGEVVTGRIAPDPVVLRTATGEVAITQADLAFLGGPTAERPLARAVLRDGRTVDGALLNEVFEIAMDLGPTLTVRATDMDFLMGREGERPREPETVAGVRVVRVTSTRDVNVSLRGHPEERGLRVVELTDDSPFRGALRPGDLIVGVAGGPYGEGVLTRAVWSMLVGNHEYVALDFVRDVKPTRILLMRGQIEEGETTNYTRGTDEAEETNHGFTQMDTEEQDAGNTNFPED